MHRGWQVSPFPKKPWETESPPMRMDNSGRMGGSGSEEFNFGLDGTSTVPINPFGREQGPTNSNPFGGDDTDFGDMNFDDMDLGNIDLGGMDPNEEIQLPPDFPDLNGMSADEMKKTENAMLISKKLESHSSFSIN